jgi:uncharacterized protein (DUF305 family)
MKNNHIKLSLLALVATLVLASCASSGGGSQGNGSGDDVEGPNHGDKSGQADGGMSGMGHGSGDMASEMLEENGKYSDERFIDAMVPHHQSAVEMAEVASEKSRNPRIKRLAENIVSAQQTEIEQLKAWRDQWYPEG